MRVCRPLYDGLPLHYKKSLNSRLHKMITSLNVMQQHLTLLQSCVTMVNKDCNYDYYIAMYLANSLYN